MSIKGEYQGQYKNANDQALYLQQSNRSTIYNSSQSNSFLEPSSKQISTSTSIKDLNPLINQNYLAPNSSKSIYTQQGQQQSFTRNVQFFENDRDDRISANNSVKISRNASLTHTQQLQKSTGYIQYKGNQGKYGVLSLKQNNQLQRKVIDIASKMEKIESFIKKHDRQILQLWKDNKDLKQVREYANQEPSGVNSKSMGTSKVSKIGNDRDKQNFMDGENLLLEKISSKISEHNTTENFNENFKKQIESIKNQLAKRVTREKLHDQFYHMETSIRTAISNMRETITKQMSQFTQNTLKQRKKDLQKLKGIVTSQVKNSEQRVKKTITSLQEKLSEIQKLASAGQIKVSTKKYQGKPLFLKVIENYSINEELQAEKKPHTPYPKMQNANINQLRAVRKSAQYTSDAQDRQNREKTSPDIYYKTLSLYKIDRQGYLLDEYSYYLLDTKGNQIRLQPQHLKLLQKTGLYY